MSRNSVRPVLYGARTYSFPIGTCFFFFIIRSCTLNRWNLLFALFTTTPRSHSPRLCIHSSQASAFPLFALFAADPLFYFVDGKYRLCIVYTHILVANIDCRSCIYIYIGRKYRLYFSVFQYLICFCRKTKPSFPSTTSSCHLTSLVINCHDTSRSNALSTVVVLQKHKLI